MTPGQRTPYEQHCHTLWQLVRDAENRLSHTLSLRQNGREIEDAVIVRLEAEAAAAKERHAKAFAERANNTNKGD